MSEFEAYNRKSGQWEVFPLSRYCEIEENGDYYVARVAAEMI